LDGDRRSDRRYLEISASSCAGWGNSRRGHSIRSGPRSLPIRRFLIDQILGESQVALALADDHDRQVDRVNNRIIQTLSEATGLKFGKDPEAWRKWWIEERGYAYKSPTPKPTAFIGSGRSDEVG